MTKSGQTGILYGVNSADIEKLNNNQKKFWKSIGKIEKINAEAFATKGKQERIITEERLYIPENVKFIGKKAFAGQHEIKEIVLPKELRFIDSEAFVDCSKLECIEIPENVEWIGNNALYCCRGLKKIVLNSFKGFSEKTILGCTNLQEIIFSEQAVKQMANEHFGTNLNFSVKEISPQEQEEIRKNRFSNREK